MLSRECFIESIRAIQKQAAVLDEAAEVLQKLSEFPVTLDFNSLYHKALMRLLEETMRDRNGWISWWLYEDVEKVVTWEKDGKEIKTDLTDVNAFYDFLAGEIRNVPVERLPLWDYDG